METDQVSGELLFKVWPWLEANRKGLIVATLAVGVFIGGVCYWTAHQQERELEAGSALTHVLASPGVTADSLAQFAAVQAGTLAATRAELEAGQSLFEKGDYAGAQAVFEKFVQTHAGTPLANQALFGLGACQEALGKLDLAAATYSRAATATTADGTGPLAKFALGRLAENQGKWSEAQGDFQEVIRTVNPQLPFANDAYRHLAMVQQQLARTSKTADAITIAPAAK